MGENDKQSYLRIYLTTAIELTANSTYGSQNVWDSKYKRVWHLRGATSGDLADSTSNNHTGTPVNSPSQIAGKIDGSLSFSGTSQYVQTASGECKTADNFTWSAWFKADSTTFAHHLLWEGTSGGNGWGPSP